MSENQEENNNINDENKDIIHRDSNSNNENNLLNKIKKILQEGGQHNLNEEKDKEIFDIFIKLSDEIFSPKTLSQSYEENIPFEKLTKKIIKTDTTRKKLLFMNFIVLPIFNIFYLIAIFEFINMTNTIFKVFYNSISLKYNSIDKDPDEIMKFSIEDFNKNYNFFNMFFEDTRRNIFNFDLIKPTAIIGTFFLRKIGFRCSSLILSIINLFSIILIIFAFPFLDYYNFNNTYPIIYIIFLFILWILLLVGVGGSSMLSQQLIMDKRDKYNEYIIKLNKKLDIKKAKKKIRKQEIKNIEESDAILITLKSPLFQEDESDEIKTNINKQEMSGSSLHDSTNCDENISENNYNHNNNNNINQSKTFIDVNHLNENQVAVQMSKTITPNTDLKEKLEEIIRSIEEKHDIEKKIRSKIISDSLTFHFITAIFAYIGVFLINNSLLEKKEENNEEYMNIAVCGKSYFCFQNVIKDKNLSITTKELFDKLNSRIYEDDRLFFIYVILICFALIILSNIVYTIFDSIFTKEETNKDEDGIEMKAKIHEFLGKMSFSLEISLKKKITIWKRILNPLRIPLIIFANFLFTIINSILRFIYNICAFGENSQLGFQIPEIGKEILKKDKAIFHIEYQKQSKLFYINNFFSGKAAQHISTYMIMYLYLQIMNLALENEYLKLHNKKEIFTYSPKLGDMNHVNKTIFFELSSGKEDNKNNNNILNIGNYLFLKTEDYHILITFTVVFLVFLCFTLAGNNIHMLFLKKREQDIINENNANANNENDNMKEEDKKEELSKGILGGIHVILYVEGIYIMFFSLMYLYDREKEMFNNVNYYLVPILLNKFYHFTMVYYCTRYSANINKYEIINGSFLISIWLYIIKIIIFFIRDLLILDNIWIQIALCAIPIIAIIKQIIIIIKSIPDLELKDLKEILFSLFCGFIPFCLKDCCYDCSGCINCLRNCCYRCCCNHSKSVENLDS